MMFVLTSRTACYKTKTFRCTKCETTVPNMLYVQYFDLTTFKVTGVNVRSNTDAKESQLIKGDRQASIRYLSDIQAEIHNKEQVR